MTVPYYPGVNVTPNLGLSLIGMDEVIAEDFILIDAFAGGASGSVEVNGSVVDNPNFVDSATVTFSVTGSNISLTAVGGGGGSGVSIPTAGTTSPTPAYAFPEAPVGVNPAFYVQDANGEWHAQAGMDTTTVMSSNRGIDGNPTNPQGVLTWDRMTFFRDTQSSVQSGKNASLSFNHLAGVGTSYNNQDRAVWVGMGNLTASVFQFSIDSSNNVTFNLESIATGFAASGAIGFRVNQRIVATGLSVGTYLNGVQLSITSATPISGGYQTIVCSDSGFTHSAVALTSDTGALNQAIYSMANVQMEQDVVGAPLFVDAVDGEVSTLSVQMSDQHTGNLSAPNYGCNAIRAQYYREAGTGQWGSVHPACIRSIVTDNNDGTHGADTITNILVIGTATAGNNDLYYGVHVNAPGVRFGTGNYGIAIDDYGANASDYALYITGGQIYLGGNITGVGAWPVQVANTVLAGPTSGANAAAAFRALVPADYPVFVGDSGSGGTVGAVPAPSAGEGASGYFLSAAGNWQIPSVPASSVAWNNITSATGNLSVNLSTFSTEFDQTSAAVWLWKNTTTGTAITTNASPVLELAANYYNGSSSAQDTWSLGTSLAAGTNGASTLTVAHSGSTGAPQIQLPTPPASYGLTNPQIIGPSGATVGISVGGNAAFPLLVATTTGTADMLRGYQGGTFQGSVTSQSSSVSFGVYGQVATSTAELGVASAPSATRTSPLTSLGHGGTTWPTTGSGPYIGLNVGAAVALGGSNSLHLNWAPVYGSGNLYAEQIAPTVNQALITNTVVGSALVSNVGAAVFSTANAYTAGAAIQIAVATNTALNGTQTLVAQAQRAGSPYTITNASEDSASHATLTVGTHNVATGDWIFVTGLTNFTWLNGQTVTVTSVVANTSVTFVDLTTHGTQASHADTGTVTDNFVTWAQTHANITGSADTGTVIQQSTGAYTALRIAVTETALAPVRHKMIDCFAGASGTTEVFAVDNTGKVTEYNGGATASQGLASEIYQTLNSSLNANFNAGTPVTMFTPTVAKSYRISACMGSNVAATAGTLPSLTAGWTDAGGIARTYTLLASTSTSATTDYVQGTLTIYTNSSTAVTITSAAYAAGSGTALTYSLSVTAEAL